MRRIRRWGQFIQAALGLLYRHPLAGTSIIAILPDGQIVLTQRQDTGKWGLPGGMVEWGEDITSTVRRELAEETGLQLVAIRRLVGVYSSPERDPRIHSVCIVVEAAVQGTLQVHDTLEIIQVQAFSLNALPQEELSYDHNQQLQNYLAGLTTLA
ncbi:MAG TPA: NUDIX hydrolase [Candidatus Caenarcaniphilales bacterium]